MKHSRGVAIIETAISVLIGMTFLCGAIGLAGLGYGQVMADGMAFERAVALSGHADYDTPGQKAGFDAATGLSAMLARAYEKRIVLSEATHTQDPGAISPTTFDYNSGPNPYLNPYGVSAQYTGQIIGGASYIRSGIQSAEYSVGNIFGLLLPRMGLNLNTRETGAAAEPVGVAVDMALGSSSSDPNDPSLYKDPSAHNWIVQASVNLAPFFLGHAIDYVCSDDYEFAQGPDCLGHQHLEAYGLAEVLDANNYNRPGIGPGDSFNAMLLHQRCFARLISGPNAIPATFPAYPSQFMPATSATGWRAHASNPYSTTQTAGALPQNLLTSNGGNPILYLMYQQWDVPTPRNNGGVITNANRTHPLVGSGSC